jgi:hypothetical protein
MLGEMGSRLLGLHKDERGAEGLEKLLIIAAIVLPLLGILIYFSKDIMTWSKELLGITKGGAPSPAETINGNI